MPSRVVVMKFVVVYLTPRSVYFDTFMNQWVDLRGVCYVNDLGNRKDDFIDCSCKHMTQYAVKAPDWPAIPRPST
jgi:hypothetical protein